jgi:cytochrome c oxidase assembly protein subunit 11
MPAPKGNRRLGLGLAAVVALMVGASFAAVPFYSWFCRVTGYAGTTGLAAAPEAAAGVVERTVTVHFDANTDPGMPWQFRPKQRSVTLRLGETGLAFFEAHNPTDRVIAGQAGFNVVPFSVGGYFDKIACFCFDLQVLGPGERVDMPVSFYVDPAMLDDLETRGVTDITLSYTMYQADLPQDDTAAVDEDTRLAAAPETRGQTIEQ